MWKVLAVIIMLAAGWSGAPAYAQANIESEFNKGTTAYNTGDFSTAAFIWGKLADEGSAKAKSALGTLYYTGSGVPRDFDRARELFLEAAAGNVPQAHMFLSLMYRKGDGVRQSYTLAYMWCDIAIAAGHEGASYVILNLAEHLTGEETLEAQRLAAEWRSLHLKGVGE
jgi:TPR repeat protein